MASNYNISSTVGSHYTTAIGAGSVETESFPGLRGDGNGKIQAVSIRSQENLAWQVELYDKNNYILAIHPFEANDAQVVTESATDYYYYYAKVEWNIPLTVPYTTVTVGIRNNSGQAKTATNTTTNAGSLILTLNISK